MTYQNDPKKDFNRPTPTRPVEPRHPLPNEGWGTGSIALASVAALALIFGLFYMVSNRGDSSLANRNDDGPAISTSSPTANTPATTGSGGAMPANPAGTAPQRDGKTPPTSR
jgi:hypothetical protein